MGRRTAGITDTDEIRLGPVALPALREAAGRELPPETRERINKLLARKPDDWPPSVLRAVRCVHLLERMGTVDAIELLKELAGGVNGAPLTEEARLAVERSERRK